MDIIFGVQWRHWPLFSSTYVLSQCMQVHIHNLFNLIEIHNYEKKEIERREKILLLYTSKFFKIHLDNKGYLEYRIRFLQNRWLYEVYNLSHHLDRMFHYNLHRCKMWTKIKKTIFVTTARIIMFLFFFCLHISTHSYIYSVIIFTHEINRKLKSCVYIIYSVYSYICTHV